eukprot:gene39730-52433_t
MEESAFTFDDFERLQAESTDCAIQMIDKKLYDGRITPSQIIPAVNVSEEIEDFSYGRYTLGYSAHNETVCDNEIDIWKSSFPYLRVEGLSLNIMEGNINTSTDAQGQLVDEEIFAIDGSMNNESICEDSKLSHSNDILDILLDNVWIQATESTRSLIDDAMRQNHQIAPDEICVWRNDDSDQCDLIEEDDDDDDEGKISEGYDGEMIEENEEGGDNGNSDGDEVVVMKVENG